MNFTRFISAILIVIYGVALPATSFAVLSSTTDANNVNQNNIKPQGIDCDSFCGALVNSDGAILGLNGQPGWQSSDNQYCADHGSPTDAAVGPSPSASFGPTNSCNVPVYAGESCTAANKQLIHCKWHNSQVEPQCMAYEAATGAGTGEDVILALDATAAAACAVACAASWEVIGAAEATQAVCTYTGVAATIGEMVQNMIDQNSAVSKTITATLGAANIAANGIMMASRNASISGTSQEGMGKAIVNGADNATAEAAGQAAGQQAGKQGATNSSAKIMSCASAVLYTIMAAMRAKDIDNQNQSKQNACNAVKQLASSAAAMNAYGSSYSYTSATAPGTSGTGVSGIVSGGTSGIVGGGVLYAQSLKGLNCIQGSGLTSCMPNQAAATDGSLLTKSGQDMENVNKARDALENIMRDAQQSPAGALNNALSGLPGGDFATHLQQLAKDAYEHAGEMGLGNSVSQAGATTTTGKSGSGSPASQGQTFSLFGHKSGGISLTGTSGELKFDKSQKRSLASDSDIWHSNWNGSIFQIVSEKINQDRDRVSQLEWATPMNRIIMGLPNRSLPNGAAPAKNRRNVK